MPGPFLTLTMDQGQYACKGGGEAGGVSTWKAKAMAGSEGDPGPLAE